MTILTPARRRALCRRLPLSAAMLSALTLSAQAMPGPQMGGCGLPATLSVTGEGRTSVAPDMATLSLGVTTQAPTAAQAMTDNATRQGAVIEAIKAQGVASADIQTSGLSLSAVQDYSKDNAPPTITGYQAQNIVTIRVRDLPRLGTVLDGLVGAGANEIQGIGFSRDDLTPAQDEARRLAVADARHRAETLAAAAGQTLGRLVALSDSGAALPPVPMMMRAEMKAGGATPVEAGALDVTAQVSAVWALEGEGAAGGACPMQAPVPAN